MKFKILITICVSVLLIGIVIGATLGISDVVITETIDENIWETGTYTFLCDGVQDSVIITEKKIDLGDIQRAVKKECSETIAKIENENKETLKQSDKFPHIKSFNETEITEREILENQMLCEDIGETYVVEKDKCEKMK